MERNCGYKIDYQPAETVSPLGPFRLTLSCRVEDCVLRGRGVQISSTKPGKFDQKRTEAILLAQDYRRSVCFQNLDENTKKTVVSG